MRQLFLYGFTSFLIDPYLFLFWGFSVGGTRFGDLLLRGFCCLFGGSFIPFRGFGFLRCAWFPGTAAPSFVVRFLLLFGGFPFLLGLFLVPACLLREICDMESIFFFSGV